MRTLIFAALLSALTCSCQRTDETKLSELRDKIEAVKGRDLVVDDKSLRAVDNELDPLMKDPLFARLPLKDRAELWAGRAKIAIELDDPRKARDYGLRALELQPDLPWTWYTVHQAQLWLEDYENAALSLSRFLAQKPGELNNVDREILDLIALTRIGSPNTEHLLSKIDPAKWTSPSSYAGEVWRRLALERLRHGDRKGAKKSPGTDTHP